MDPNPVAKTADLSRPVYVGAARRLAVRAPVQLAMMGEAFSPVNLLEEGGQEAKGEQARMASIVGALAIADLVKTSLGPKGMAKILQSAGRGNAVSKLNSLSQKMLIAEKPSFSRGQDGRTPFHVPSFHAKT